MILYQPNNILVTGGAGFIGTNFIRHVLTETPQTNIVNLDALTYAGSLENLENLPNPDSYCFIKGDIGNPTLVDRILNRHHIDTIVHFAAESHVDRSIATPALFIDTNIKGTGCLLESARQYWTKQFSLSPDRCRFYHVSTDEVFGSLHADDLPRKETDRYQPSSPYAASKASSDHLVQAYYKTYRLPIVMSYSANNYGPYQHYEKFIPTIINSCYQKQKIPIYGDGKNMRDWLYVEDHCTAINAILNKGVVSETYHIASGNETSNNELVQMICSMMDKALPTKIPYHSLLSHVTDRPGHDFRYALNIEKIKNQVGWSPSTDIIEGLTRTIEFYLKKMKTLIHHEDII